MNLSASDVIDLQFFLMDGARRYVSKKPGATAGAGDLLASAAALDYALLFSSERANEPLDDEAPVAESLRTTMARAVTAALDLVESVLAGPNAELADFTTRQGRSIFATIATLRARGLVSNDDIAFRALTLAHDARGRRCR